ncbi:hypothetical protein OXX79_011545 [Metschnikowia pulcherrima]
MEEEYLQDGFDPSTLKVANLRGILFNNGVSYPSNAKKSELVDLFHEKITKKPKSSKTKKGPLSEEEKEAKRLRKERKAKKQNLKKNLEDPDNEFDGKSEESRPTTAIWVATQLKFWTSTSRMRQNRSISRSLKILIRRLKR